MSTVDLLHDEEVSQRFERSRGDGAPSPNLATTEYEEFFSGTVPCPSCRGLGRIPKEQEQQLVAIIPLNDKRLKPSRSYIYVILAIVICILIAGLALFFLLPRTIHMGNTLSKLTPRHSMVNETQRIVILDVMVPYNVTNNNYFPVTLVSVEVFSVFDTKIVGQNMNNTEMTLPMRGTRLYETNLNMTFKGDEGYIAYYCSGTDVVHSLLLPISSTATTSYMGHTEETTLTIYQHVECNPTPKRR